MEKLARKILRARIPIIAITALLTVVFGYGLTRLTINSDVISYLKRNDPAVTLFNRIGEEYEGNLAIFTLVRAKDIYDPQTLSFIRDLTELYRRIEGVSSVTSLANIIDIRDSEFGIEIGELMPGGRIPADPEEIAELKSRIGATDLYKGKVVSEDGSVSVIVSRMNPRYNRIDVANELIARTREVRGNRTVQFTGYPVQMAEVNRFVSDDLKRLVPIVVVVIVGVLFASFRTARGILLPLAIVLISTVWTLGIMGFARVPLTIMSNVVPVALLAIGTAYGIHFVARYNEDLSTEERTMESLARTLSTVGVPILLAGLTTILGFLSFTGAYLTAVTEFGVFTAVGVFFAMTLSLTLVPSVLSFGKAKTGEKKKNADAKFGSLMEGLGRFAVRRSTSIVIFSALGAMSALFAFPRIDISTKLTTYFPSNSEIRNAESTLNGQFGGSIPFQVVVKGDLGNPAVLRELSQTEKYLSAVPGVRNTQSIADLVCRMNELLNGRKTVPQTREELANLLFMLEGQEILEQLVKKDYSEGVIQAVYGEENAAERNKTIGRIRSYLESRNRGGIAVVRMGELAPADRAIAEKAVLGDIADALVYDLRPYGELEMETVGEALDRTRTDLGNRIAPSERASLEHELDTYLREESELWIESENDRSRIVDGILDSFSSTKPDFESVKAALISRLPERYRRTAPEAVSSAAEHIAARIGRAQEKSAVDAWADALERALFPGRAGDGIITAVIRNNLWPYFEETAKVPRISFEGKTGIVDEPGCSMELGGMLVVVNMLDRFLLKSQVQSIVIALIAVFLLLLIQFKSVRMGIVTLSPILLVILFNFAILGFLKIPLDYATMLVASLLIGVGIDYSIHFTSRYVLERRARTDRDEAILRTLGTTGRAIVVNAAMVAFGFFVLVGGNLVPIRRAGWIIGALMLLSAFVALVYLPALLVRLGGFLERKRENHGARRYV